MPAKVLVTGASGFLAGHVVQQLQSEGHEVRGTVRSVKNADKVQHLYNLCPTATHRLQLVEADLTKPETWQPAVKGMDFVIHTASPFPLAAPKHEDEVIRPAVEGTLAVLRACAKTHSVRRVVLTSSVAAIDWDISKPTPKPVLKSEENWTNPDKTNGYVKSKVLAEKAAWDFVRNLSASDNIFELVVINPSFILGPPLQGSSCTSVEVIKMLLERKLSKLPRVHLDIVDVRDVARAHVLAMTVAEAAGKRIIAHSDGLWFGETGKLLSCVFGPQGYNVPTAKMSNFILWFGSLFSKEAKTMYHSVDIEHSYDNRRMKQLLQIEPRNVRDTLVDMSYALIEAGFVKKTNKYRGPGGPQERQKYMQASLS